MKTLLVVRSLIVSVCLHVGMAPPRSILPAPPGTDSDLTKIILAQDAVLFDAVNRCDLKTVESKFALDVEFYHDKDAPQYGRAIVLKNLQANLCGKIQRDLVAGSVEVHPIHDYGAVQLGIHRFRHIGTQDRDVVGEAKFIHLWRLKDGAWQITRVISYDHDLAK